LYAAVAALRDELDHHLARPNVVDRPIVNPYRRVEFDQEGDGAATGLSSGSGTSFGPATAPIPAPREPTPPSKSSATAASPDPKLDRSR
jgi:hypothetical protein